ncbi:MAG: extracellular solute-binding protein [Ornithinimicrobium sp.]|uniref:ABC transporter substrate-binding protein n=1 Tax=Ornithinimicrobium sp. TaxID=1977084 RepID=UPI0026DF6DDB|nr:extracellular solute-binding protein [Ornithinimicrobium sp.]MDO5738785.1 extracellular solute-binding protein [Ornithinimicrobium sp.]
MKTTRATAYLAALALGLGSLAACAPSTPGTPAGDSSSADAADLSSPAEKSGTITMLTKFAAPEYAPYFEAVVAAYEKENPDVTIDLQQVGDQPYKDKIRVLSASKELPDIYFSWAGDFANKFVRAGLAADLSGELAPDTEWGGTFAPAALEAFATDGKYYGVPINLDAKYLAYSEAAFDKAGVDAVPATFAELLDACGKLTDAGYTPIAFGNQYGWPAIHYMTQLNAFNVAPDTLAKDYNPASGEFTDAGYVTALAQMKSLSDACFNDGVNGLSHEVAQANLMSGKAAMQYIEIVEFPTLVGEDVDPAFKDNWSFFRLPPADDAAGSTTTLTGAPDGFMVNQGSENPALALDFLKFMTNMDNATKLTTDIGWLSPVEGAAEKAGSFPQLQEGLKDIGTADDFAIWLDTVVNADVAAAYLAGVQGLLDESQTPEDVMKSVQKAAADAKKSVG